MKKILTTEDIVHEAQERVRRFAGRDLLYDAYLSYYFGKQGRGSMELPTLAMNAQGRPLLRQIGESINVKRAYSTQRLPPVVDDYTALVGRMPTVRTEPPAPDEQGEQKAEKQTKYLYSTYEMSDMWRQQAMAGFYLSDLGDAVYLLHPDPDELRPVWEVISPRHAYPAFGRGHKRFQVYDLIVAFQLDEDTIEREYEITPYSDEPEDCTCITYISPHQRTIVVGTRRPRIAADVAWDIGACPAVWAFNKINGEFGSSDIAQSLDQQDFMDFLANLLSDGLVYRTYPIIGIKNPMNVGELTVGPDAPPVPMQGDGDIVVREIQGDVKTTMELMHQTMADMNATTGSSQVRQEGQMKSSIVTGRAVHAVQGPQSTRIELKQQILGASIQKMNELTFALQEKAPLLKEAKLEIQGRWKGKTFRQDFSPQDIDGWYRNTVSWDELVGLNMQQKTAAAYEGLAAKLWDDLHAMEMVGIDDPIEMRKRIETMLISQARMQHNVESIVGGQQQQGQSQPGAAPTGNAPSSEPQSSGSGQPPFTMQYRPPEMGGKSAAPPTGVPQGATREVVSAALVKIADKLKGHVFAIGELAREGFAAQATLAISDPRDYNMVLQTVRQIDPKVKVRHLSEDKMPLDAIKVA